MPRSWRNRTHVLLHSLQPQSGMQFLTNLYGASHPAGHILTQAAALLGTLLQAAALFGTLPALQPILLDILHSSPCLCLSVYPRLRLIARLAGHLAGHHLTL